MTRGRISIGISSCLLGERVRYDGNHKRDDYIVDVLSKYFRFVPFCPEVAIGLGVPRATIRLRQTDRGVRAVQPDAGDRDVTDALAACGRRVGDSETAISGYLFKSRSPSCGIARVRIYDRSGSPSGTGPGIYAQALRESQPLLPVEDEGRLNDAGLRDNFIERVFVYRRWQELLARGPSAAALVRFHAEHKYLILAHNQAALRDMGRMVANLKRDVAATADAYVRRLMQALSRPATRAGHVNALQHVAGFFKRTLDSRDRRELHEAIEDYRRGGQPIAVPLTLIRHHLRRHPDAMLARQTYLDAAPRPSPERGKRR